MRVGRTIPPAAAPLSLREIIRAFSAINSGWKEGPEKLESELKTSFGQKYCFLVSSGKAALTLILIALRQLHPEKNEVLIPAFTCFSVPAAIKKAGLRIRLCDIDPATLDLSRRSLRSAITTDEKTRLLCVVPTHLFGYPVNISTLREIVGNKVAIVEDAAQAMGGDFAGKKLGTMGDVGFFSLGRGKALSTIEGGVIVTNRDDIGRTLKKLVDALPKYTIAEKIILAAKALLTTILQHPSLFWLPKALPFLKLGETLYEQEFSLKKLSPVQAGLATNWQKRLSEHAKVRRKNIIDWGTRLQPFYSRWCSTSIGRPANLIRLPVLAPNLISRQTIVSLSEQQGLGVMPPYPTPINEIPALATELAGEKHPNAVMLCRRLLTIPVHEFVTSREKNKISCLLSNYGMVKTNHNNDLQTD